MKLGKLLNKLENHALNATSGFSKAGIWFCGGEIAYRVIKAVSHKAPWICNNTLVNFVSQKTPELAGRMLRPYQGFSRTELMIATAACVVAKLACREFVALRKGEKQSPLVANIKAFPGYLFSLLPEMPKSQ